MVRRGGSMITVGSVTARVHCSSYSDGVQAIVDYRQNRVKITGADSAQECPNQKSPIRKP